MSFALCLGPEALIIMLVLLVLAGLVCAAGVAAAIYATIGLAKLAAARHNRLVANAK